MKSSPKCNGAAPWHVRVGSFVKEQLSVPEHGKPMFLIRVGNLIKKHLHIPEHG
uniref:hypothetical protein n=1 Tax=Ruminococcus bromii TaxID=40518 RepID=UPI0026F21B67|nr:hypothetical protein [Ruminococcus bromii]